MLFFSSSVGKCIFQSWVCDTRLKKGLNNNNPGRFPVCVLKNLNPRKHCVTIGTPRERHAYMGAAQAGVAVRKERFFGSFVCVFFLFLSFLNGGVS